MLMEADLIEPGTSIGMKGDAMSKVLAELTVDRGPAPFTIELEDTLQWHADAAHAGWTGYLNEVCRIDPLAARQRMALRHQLFQCAHRLGAEVRIFR